MKPNRYAIKMNPADDRMRQAIKCADEIITDSWGEDQMERGDCQAVNILRAALAVEAAHD